MSLNSRRTPVAIRVRQQLSLDELLFEEGVEVVRGKLENIYCPSWQLSLDEADWCATEGRNLSEEQFKNFLRNKCQGARWMAWRIRHGEEPDLRQLASDWAARQDILRWMNEQDPEWLIDLSLATKSWDKERDCYVANLQPGKLMYLGIIRFAWQAERFCKLYNEVCVKNRPWGSCYQPNQHRVAAIALTPNYNRLPLWVKKVLVKSSHWIQEEDGRVGNIWRLIDCAKAWKWCPNLPKGLAEKVGRMPARSRIIAKLAWNCIEKANGYYHAREGWKNFRKGGWKKEYYHQGEYQVEAISRGEVTKVFWEEFRRLSSLSIFTLIEVFSETLGHNQTRVLVEQTLGLPFGFLWDTWGRKRNASTERYTEAIAAHSTPSEACQHFFGCKGKATVKAFQSSSRNGWKWAAALAYGNADLVQKYLLLRECIEYEPEAVEFLKQLGDAPALRMVGTTTFKIRGEVKGVESFHVKDTGYLWNQIRNKPELGRVRCWLSVHEELARRFIAEQPDNALKVDSRWLPIDGLCAIDGSWQFEIPRRTATLKFWGEQLHHCVGSYGPKINSGDCVIFAVKVDGWVKYTVEMCPSGNRWYCNQFYGDRNSSPPSALKSSVLAALSQAGLLASDRY